MDPWRWVLAGRTVELAGVLVLVVDLVMKHPCYSCIQYIINVCYDKNKDVSAAE